MTVRRQRDGRLGSGAPLAVQVVLAVWAAAVAVLVLRGFDVKEVMLYTGPTFAIAMAFLRACFRTGLVVGAAKTTAVT